MPERVVLLARKSTATAILYHALAPHFDVQVVYELPPSARALLRLRIKRLGWWKVFGQVLFQVIVAKPQARWSIARQRAILQERGASDAAIPGERTRICVSVNGEDCWQAVKELEPKVVVINGTRILSARTIGALGIPVLNTHVGITPMYRGVHGAYWALVRGDAAHCGVTVHLVDEGIDTGAVLYQTTIAPTASDNFSTYPTLQMVAGSALMVKAVGEIMAGTARPVIPAGVSARWYHPTLWTYWYNRIVKGVR
jgi:folate-dependent phosphoribosylglycinamide formyltransferase PurN